MSLRPRNSGWRPTPAAAVLALVVAVLTVPVAQADVIGEPPVPNHAHSKVVDDDPVRWTPHVTDGRVKAIVEVGGTVILGGQFSQVTSSDGERTYSRTNLLAFDATTGAVSETFAPKVDGEVTSLQVAGDGESVYVGGFFDNVNGTFSRGVARLDLADGRLTSGFDAPKLDGRVKDLRLRGDRLWVAGTFGYVDDHRQAGLATLDAETGAFDPYNRVTFSDPYRGGVMQVMKIDVTPDNSRLLAIGNFAEVNGHPRPQIAMLDIDGQRAELAGWQTDFYEPACSRAFHSYMRDLDISPDGTYVVVTTSGAWHGNDSPCDTTARWELAPERGGLEPTWIDYSGGDTMYAVEVTGVAVYLGGHFRWQNNPNTDDGDSAGAGAVERSGIAALDPANGLPLPWNPGRTTGIGVFDMLATTEGLWVVSDTDRIGDWEYHGRLAFFPLAGGTPMPESSTGQLPGDVYLTRSGPAATTLVRRHYDGNSFGADRSAAGGTLDWGSARGGFLLAGELYLGTSDGEFSRRSFDGRSFGTATTIDTADQLVRDDDWHDELSEATGLMFADGGLYYTLPGSKQLYYRYFTPESGVVGATRFSVGDSPGAPDLSNASGLFVQPGFLYWGSEDDGRLRRAEFAGGRVTPDSVEVVSGPRIDGRSWESPTMFVLGGAPAPAEDQPTDDQPAEDQPTQDGTERAPTRPADQPPPIDERRPTDEPATVPDETAGETPLAPQWPTELDWPTELEWPADVEQDL